MGHKEDEILDALIEEQRKNPKSLEELTGLIIRTIAYAVDQLSDEERDHYAKLGKPPPQECSILVWRRGGANREQFPEPR
jgi:hypothetical protein